MKSFDDTAQFAIADRSVCAGNKRMKRTFAAILALLAASPVHSEVSYASSGDFSHAIGETMVAIDRVDGRPVCFPEVDARAKVVILSSSQGGIKFAGFGPANSPALAQVNVSATGEPVYLVLAGYNSIVWRIVAEPGANIAAVALSGYHQQLVLDLPFDTKLGSRAFVRDEVIQSLECIHTVDLDPDQQKAWDTNTFSSIDSTIQAERLFSVLKSYGPLELRDHQFQSGAEGQLIFEVSD